MRYSLPLLCGLLVLTSVLGCRKKKNAGLGGENELQITVKHHTVVLDSITVYVKFNEQDAPESTSEYEISAEVKEYDGKQMAIFTDLKDGEYYLYGEGWDPSLPANVKGGLPISICEESSPIEYDLQVTEEGHN